MRCVRAPIQPPHMFIFFSTQKVERGFMALIIVVLILLQSTICHSQPNINNSCTSSCGNLRSISYPFRVKGDPEKCGEKRYEIACENNVATMSVGSGRYYMQAINYSEQTFRLVDPGVDPNNCSSTPLYFLSYDNSEWGTATGTIRVVYLTCAEPVNDPWYVSTAPCTGEHHQGAAFSYAVVGSLAAKDIKVGCQVKLVVLTDWMDWGLNNSYDDFQRLNYSYADIHRHLVHGFELSWSVCDGITGPGCTDCEDYRAVTFHECGIWRTLRVYLLTTIGVLLDWPFLLLDYNNYGNNFLIPYVSGLEVLHALKVTLGAPCVIIFLFRKWRKRHLSMYDNIEQFLESNNSLMPIRYSYKEIRNMTKGFKDKLGEGGFGTVFKGKLRSRSLVAVKMLSNSKANGQDFMSEIGTIGRIHHVNVVRLIGYCVEGSKCALVYEFMSNGSLDKYIFSKEEEGLALSLKKIYEISIGVARGIAYLHQGCDMQILHFDVKPHNILLDENFTPKVSDFGLAKLYPINESIVPLTAARGTMGYMAPELFYKNIGGVSYKADVYSFGMLLLEMAGRRKNLNPFAENSSEIYFPSWVYDQFTRGNEFMEITNATEEERKLVKKMITVAFWCIQMKPSVRPTMKKVVEMLESEVECLPTPPKPFISVLDLPSNNASSSSHKKPTEPSLNSVGSSESESDSIILNAT